jgi:hypothetical protein
MNHRIAKKWIDALCSGEYKQTTSTLKDACGFCCLGVLTDLAIKEGVFSGWDDSSVQRQRDAVEFAPGEVCEWSGLKVKNGAVFDRSLSSLNDTGYTFEEIAGVIQCAVEEL